MSENKNATAHNNPVATNTPNPIAENKTIEVKAGKKGFVAKGETKSEIENQLLKGLEKQQITVEEFQKATKSITAAFAKKSREKKKQLELQQIQKYNKEYELEKETFLNKAEKLLQRVSAETKVPIDVKRLEDKIPTLEELLKTRTPSTRIEIALKDPKTGNVGNKEVLSGNKALEKAMKRIPEEKLKSLIGEYGFSQIIDENAAKQLGKNDTLKIYPSVYVDKRLGNEKKVLFIQKVYRQFNVAVEVKTV